METAWFAQGNLPAVCARSGLATNNFVAVRLGHAPQWLLVFLIFGLLPYFLLASIITEKTEGYLPVHPDIIERTALKRRISLLVIGAGFACFVAGLFLGAEVLAMLSLLAGLTGMCGLVFVSRTYGVTGSIMESNRQWFTLQNVHPNFAGPIEQMYAPNRSQSRQTHPTFRSH